MKYVWALALGAALSVGCDNGSTSDDGGTSDFVSGPAGLDESAELLEPGATTSEGSAPMNDGMGTGAGESEAPPEDVACEAVVDGVTQISGHVFGDMDDSSMSVYASEPSDGDALEEGWPVSLLPEGIDTTTCDDGQFSFSNLADGVYVLDMKTGNKACTTRNCPVRFADAVKSGKVRITTFGDSVPKVGSSYLFPLRLQNILGEIVEVENRNVAIPGSRSVDWIPGMYNFDQELAPLLEETDVLIASIGGNDVTQYASEVLSSGQVMEVLNGGVNDKLMEILGNVIGIFEEARKINPDMDLVYCLYPNYANSTQWDDFLGAAGGLGFDVKEIVSGLIVGALDQVRAEMPDEPGMILVDIYGALGNTDISHLLYDQLHFNDDGHQLYAEEIFRALGGVIVAEGESSEHNVGIVGDQP